MTNEEIEAIKEEMCDCFCKFTSILGQEELDAKCDECPLNELKGE